MINETSIPLDGGGGTYILSLSVNLIENLSVWILAL